MHDPFTRATGEPDEPDEPEKNVGQNIVCARTSAGYPIANKPVMPKDTAKLENLGIPRRMPRPRFKVGNVYFIFRQCLVVLLQRLEKIVAIRQRHSLRRRAVHPHLLRPRAQDFRQNA